MSHLYRVGVLMICLLSSLLAVAQVPDTKYSDGIAYISGGVGLEESEAILAEAKQWSVLLELSQLEGARGVWIFGAQIKIINTKQKVIFDAQAEGPYILINLEPGEYVLQAAYRGVEQKRAISVKPSQSQKITIFWK